MRARHLAVLCVLCLGALLVALGALAAPLDAGDGRAVASAPLARGVRDAASARSATTDAAGDGAAEDAGATDAADDAEPTESADAATAPSATPSAIAPPPSAKPAEAQRNVAEGAAVRLRDRRVFSIRAARAGLSEVERARRASAALERAFEENEAGEVRVDESHPDLAIVLVGNRPIVELTQADADAAGDVSLHAHAAATAENVRAGLKTERTRRDISKRVFSWSLIILGGLAAFLGLRKAREISVSGRKWIGDHPQRLPSLHVGSVELLRPSSFQALLKLAITLVEWAAELAILYIWLVFVLSQFERTRELSGKITTTVLTPLGALAGRVALSLPLLAVTIVAGVVVFLVVRFIRLFFRSVEIGETELSWVPRDLAPATSAALRIAVVVGAIVVGAPLVTSTEQGEASRAGFVLLVALALGLVPLAASMTVGFSTVFWRRIQPGEFVSFEGRQGRVTSVTLLEVRVQDGEGAELRVPHLLTLFKPMRVLGPFPLAAFEIVVDAKAPQDEVRKVIAEAGASKHGEPRVRLLAIDADGARYEIVAKRALDEDDPATAVTRALLAAGIQLGRARTGS